MNLIVDGRKTLTELEGQDWGPPKFGSHLVETIHQLRHKPLNDFTVADLQIVIGQQMGLEYLVPIAIGRLRDDPLLEGDYFCGDLLKAVLTVKADFWVRHTELRQVVAEIAHQAESRSRQLTEIEREALEIGLRAFNLSESSGQQATQL